MTWTVTVPDPGVGWLSTNDREHWAARARRVKAWRVMGAWQAHAAAIPSQARVHVLATIRPTTARRRDVHNLLPTCKAIVDGLVDAGVIPDDADRYLVGPDLRPGTKALRRAEVVLTITAIDPDPVAIT